MAISMIDTYNIYSNPYRYNPVKATSGIGKILLNYAAGTSTSTGTQQTSDQVTLSHYGKTLSTLETFRTALSDLKTVQGVAPFKASSSANSVLTADASDKTLSTGNYTVNVSDLATAQALTSQTFEDKHSTTIGTGTLTLETGSYHSTTHAFTSGSSKTISISASNGTLNGIADAINNADAGITASINQVSGGYQLRLTSTETGTDHTLRISATPPSGATTTGLSAFAYDPAGTKTLTETTVAQNAALTVGTTASTSQSNDVTTAITGVTLGLEDTGTAKVTVTRDGEAFTKAAQKLVDAYNALQKALKAVNGNAENGLINKISSDLSGALSQTSVGFGNHRVALSDLGITKQSDGTLALNTSKLQSALTANPDNTAKLLANTAEKLSNTALQDSSTGSSLQFAMRALSKTVQSTTHTTELFNSTPSTSAYGSAFSQARLYAMIAAML